MNEMNGGAHQQPFTHTANTIYNNDVPLYDNMAAAHFQATYSQDPYPQPSQEYYRGKRRIPGTSQNKRQQNRRDNVHVLPMATTNLNSMV